MLAITVLYEVKREHVDEFREAVLLQASNSRSNEQGCLRFDVSFDPEAPHRVFLYEVYESQAAFESHAQTEYFHRYAATIQDWVVNKERAQWDLTSC